MPLTKVMQVSQMNPQVTLDSMIRALETGNYSVVIAWLHDDLTDARAAIPLAAVAYSAATS